MIFLSIINSLMFHISLWLVQIMAETISLLCVHHSKIMQGDCGLTLDSAFHSNELSVCFILFNSTSALFRGLDAFYIAVGYVNLIRNY